MIGRCMLCPRSCGADRSLKAGFCGMGENAVVAKAMVHKWEEPVISGERGSGAVFFSGCTLGCVYCQNSDISSGKTGREVTPRRLAEITERLEALGCHNIDFITGTQFIPSIIAALKLRPPKIPVVWNSGGYESRAAIDALAQYVDIWLPDYKYALAACAQKYSAAPDYPETALAALTEMRKAQKEDVIEDGIMKKGMIVRHLILPGNTKNSAAALRAVAQALPGTLVSVMSQYIPCGRAAEFPEINRPITAREHKKITDLAIELGIDGFVQDRRSASSVYVPDFQSEDDLLSELCGDD